jgi:vacuolar-type H+-ATPase subunit H
VSFYEVLTLGGVMATILGVFLTLYAIINNRTLKAEARNIIELISEFRREHQENIKIMTERLDEFRREHQETIKIMTANLDEFRREHQKTMQFLGENLKESRERLDEFRREHREKMDEFRKSHEEMIKYIADLIVANGERTRQEIRRKVKR